MEHYDTVSTNDVRPCALYRYMVAADGRVRCAQQIRVVPVLRMSSTPRQAFFEIQLSTRTLLALFTKRYIQTLQRIVQDAEPQYTNTSAYFLPP